MYQKAKKLIQDLKKIPDYRVDIGKIEYPLNEVLFMTLFALLKGNTTFKDIFAWMTFNTDNEVLKIIFEKDDIKIPSRSTLHTLLINTDNNALETVFRNYFLDYILKKSIAVDGKWLNGSDINGQYTQATHKAILNILDKDIKIVFAHKFLDKNKRSEIKALEEILLDDNLFSEDEQIFSFDALMTQVEILNTINTQKNKYIAKVKSNQKSLRDKVVLTSNNFVNPIESFTDSKQYKRENSNKSVVRTVDIYYNKDTNLVMHHNKFDNIQTIIKVTKEVTNLKTGVIKSTIEYLIANFRTTAEDFYNKILQHWRVETYHYHLDVLTKEDEHIAYKEPFSIAILRSFTINLYQLFLNSNKNKKILPTGKTTMAEIKRNCLYRDNFTASLFEQESIH